MSGERWVVQEATGSEDTTTIILERHGEHLHRIKYSRVNYLLNDLDFCVFDDELNRINE